MSRISPLSDLAVKKVLASEENKDILAGLIEDFFDVKAEGIVIEKPYSIAICKEFADSGELTKLRETLKDIAASFNIADFVSEIQIRKTNFFDERFLYYPLERYCRNYSKAEAMKLDAGGKPIRFSSLRPVYALNILGFSHFNDDEALRILELCDQKRNKRLEKELLRIGFFELTKDTVETANQGHWRNYFLTGEAHPDAPDYIHKASQNIRYVNLSEEERDMISTMERLEANDQVEREYMRDAARAEGEQSKAMKIVKAMLGDGEPPEKIARYTDLSLEFIKTLIQ